jgi:hypothetical protein
MFRPPSPALRAGEGQWERVAAWPRICHSGDMKSSSALLPLAFLLGAIGLLAVAFFKGAVWASESLLPPLTQLGWAAFLALVFVLLPLSLVSRIRGHTGTGILLCSYLFGLVCWMSGLLATYQAWGMTGVVLGLMVVGVGVVPVGILASALHGDWNTAGTLAGLALLTVATRSAGRAIGAAWKPRAPRAPS